MKPDDDRQKPAPRYIYSAIVRCRTHSRICAFTQRRRRRAVRPQRTDVLEDIDRQTIFALLVAPNLRRGQRVEPVLEAGGPVAPRINGVGGGPTGKRARRLEAERADRRLGVWDAAPGDNKGIDVRAERATRRGVDKERAVCAT
jgi:hypothetical protein